MSDVLSSTTILLRLRRAWIRFAMSSRRRGSPATSRGLKTFCLRGDVVHEDGLLQELLLAEWELRRRMPSLPSSQTYLERFPRAASSSRICGTPGQARAVATA